MKRTVELVLAAVGFTLVTLAPPAMSQSAVPRGIKIGYLSCHVASGFGLIIASSRHLACTFTSSDGKSTEHYNGDIQKWGADIGYLQSGVILWEVLAPSNTRVLTGGLEGHYGGATAGATVGLGAGMNVLIGGMDSTVSLQPISIEGNMGLNVAAGIATMNLKHVEQKSSVAKK